VALLKYAIASTMGALPRIDESSFYEFEYYPPLSHPDSWAYIFHQPEFQDQNKRPNGKILWIAVRAIMSFYGCAFTLTQDATPLIAKRQSFTPHGAIPLTMEYWAYIKIKGGDGDEITLLDYLTRIFVLDYSLERARERNGKDAYSTEDERKIIIKLYMATMFIMAQPKHEAIYNDWERLLVTWKTRVGDIGKYPRLWGMFTSVTKDMIARYEALMGIFKLSGLAKLQLDSMLLRSMIVKHLGFAVPASPSSSSSSSKSQSSRAEKRKAASSSSDETSKRSKRD
jgi:hypothetical protein